MSHYQSTKHVLSNLHTASITKQQKEYVEMLIKTDAVEQHDEFYRYAITSNTISITDTITLQYITSLSMTSPFRITCFKYTSYVICDDGIYSLPSYNLIATLTETVNNVLTVNNHCFIELTTQIIRLSPNGEIICSRNMGHGLQHVGNSLYLKQDNKIYRCNIDLTTEYITKCSNNFIVQYDADKRIIYAEVPFRRINDQYLAFVDDDDLYVFDIYDMTLYNRIAYGYDFQLTVVNDTICFRGINGKWYQINDQGRVIELEGILGDRLIGITFHDIIYKQKTFGFVGFHDVDVVCN